MKLKKSLKKEYSLFTGITAFILVLTLMASVTAFAWLFESKMLGAYAPISSPESLYIGAGHSELENYRFENIRYLYFYGIDANNADQYHDYLFCVYGKGIYHYQLQLSYTTNNQFTYELYRANEYTSQPEGYCLSYTMHSDPFETYYYTMRSDEGSDPVTYTPLAGDFLNEDQVNSEFQLAKDGDTYYDLTYINGENSSYQNVNQFARPLYWQTTNAEEGNRDDVFANYYILRIKVNGRINDRETDVICISAKSVSSSGNSGD